MSTRLESVDVPIPESVQVERDASRALGDSIWPKKFRDDYREWKTTGNVRCPRPKVSNASCWFMIQDLSVLPKKLEVYPRDMEASRSKVHSEDEAENSDGSSGCEFVKVEPSTGKKAIKMEVKEAAPKKGRKVRTCSFFSVIARE